MGAGLGLALLLEAFDSAVHDERTLTRLSGAPPFAAVGYIETSAEVNRQAQLRRRLVGMAIGALLAVLVLVHLFVKPLDVAWFVLLNRLGF